MSRLFLGRGVIVLFGRVYISSIWKSDFNSYILKAHVGACITLSFPIILIVQKPVFISPSFTFHLYKIIGVYIYEWFGAHRFSKLYVYNLWILFNMRSLLCISDCRFDSEYKTCAYYSFLFIFVLGLHAKVRWLQQRFIKVWLLTVNRKLSHIGQMITKLIKLLSYKRLVDRCCIKWQGSLTILSGRQAVTVNGKLPN